MQSQLRHSDWDECGVQYNNGTVTYVYRRAPGELYFEPWVVVGPSAILARVGARGLGLYAATAFRRDDYVGQYDGRVVGWYPTRAAALSAPETRRLLMRGHDKLLTVRAQGPGFHLIDGEQCTAPYIPRANDPRGTALHANAEVTDAGWLRITQARVPAFDLQKPLADNIYSELRVHYDEHYWDLHDLLGQTSEYAIECD